MTLCGTCHLPLDSLVRDEARLSVYQVLHRCAECSHIIVYRSTGLSEPSETEINRNIGKLARTKPGGT